MGFKKEIFDGIGHSVAPAIMESVYETVRGQRMRLDVDWQLDMAKKLGVSRKEILGNIEVLKNKGLLIRKRIGIYHINEKYLNEREW